MYVYNFPQRSNVETFFDQWPLIASDDRTPIQNSEVVVFVQMWARSSRGYGDQSQFIGNWPSLYGGGYNAIPSFSANTQDGTGYLTLYNGTLQINIPASIMQRLVPGYYEMGFTISTPDRSIVSQLIVGIQPLYNGGVWTA